MKQFRETLLEQRATLLKAQETSRDNGLNPSFSDIEQEGGGHAFHMADLGTDNMNREQQYMLAARADKALKTIQQALDRIDEGLFGKCEFCDGSIGADRLLALPDAKLCIQCQSENERRPQW